MGKLDPAELAIFRENSVNQGLILWIKLFSLAKPFKYRDRLLFRNRTTAELFESVIQAGDHGAVAPCLDMFIKQRAIINR